MGQGLRLGVPIPPDTAVWQIGNAHIRPFGEQGASGPPEAVANGVNRSETVIDWAHGLGLDPDRKAVIGANFCGTK